ncbi:polysaccharide deacetylase family protein [Streptomyces sp. NPDC049954]|uniref:polysaccharide deacetylase family protein n=1 Tax=Streptomyces sp. NPDC049954 TaxID=3155779 RepID=UPI0034374E56
MPSQHLSSLTPGDALRASQSLVARRRGVPMLVSLRAAPPSSPAAPAARRGGGPGSAGAELADAFTEYHARLSPDTEGTEAAVVAALQALAYAHLGPDRPAAPRPEPGNPAGAVPGPPLSADPGVSAGATAADLRAGNFLRLVNYHNTPAGWKDELVTELRGYARDFGTVGVEDLEHFARTGQWRSARPGLLPVFYEGYRDNYEVAAAACEEAGVTGWFFVCTQFVDTPAEEQYDYALAHRIKLVPENPRAERIAMSWEEIADLHRRGHVVTPHTASHALARSVRTAADIDREVSGPKRLMDRATGGSARCTAWLEGTNWTGESPADQALTGSGYHFVFSNTMVQRLPG